MTAMTRLLPGVAGSAPSDAILYKRLRCQQGEGAARSRDMKAYGVEIEEVASSDGVIRGATGPARTDGEGGSLWSLSGPAGRRPTTPSARSRCRGCGSWSAGCRG